MHLLNLVSAALLGSCVAASAEEIAVFELGARQPETAPVVSKMDAVLYLSDKFDVSSFYKLGDHGSESIQFLGRQHEMQDPEAASKLKLVVLLNGVDAPADFFNNTPSFVLSNHGHHGRHGQHRFANMLFNRVPHQYVSVHGSHELHSLTHEIKLVAPNSTEHSLVDHFRYFNDQLVTIWNTFKKTATRGPGQVLLTDGVDQQNFHIINDRFFINELTQLVHLASVDTAAGDLLFVKLDALLLVGRKIGYDSQTYRFLKKVLADYLVRLLAKYDVTVVNFPVSDNHNADLDRRSRELNEVFSVFEKRAAGSSSAAACFSSEDACVAGTSSCSLHGACTESGAGCWQCACKATFDKKASKTTEWTGYDCAKKDISAQANLLFWTSLAVVLLFVGGVNLLYSVGNTPLPGVLDAATSKKSA